MAKKEQVEIAEEIQDLLLQNFKELLISGTATATDRATICRWLSHNDWSVSPADAPADLLEILEQGRKKKKLTLPSPDVEE
jgi:hypothetical protein